MAKSVNPKMVGGFVAGAFLLAVGVVALFGGGRLFEDRQTFVVFFDESISGLKVGASVLFRGVAIGSVSDITIIYNRDSLDLTIPVLIELEQGRVKEASARKGDPKEEVPKLIERGLRAQLMTESMVTGEKLVMFDLHPGTEARLRKTDLPYIEIPSIPSSLEKLQGTLSEVADKAPELVDNAQVVLKDLDDVLSEQNKKKFSAILANLALFTDALGSEGDNVKSTISDAAAVMANLRTSHGRVNKLIDDGDEALIAIRDLVDNLDEVVKDGKGNVHQAVKEIAKAADGIDKAARDLEVVLEENREGVRDFTTTGLYEITNLMTDTQALVEDVRRVVEDLERSPSQFFFGDQKPTIEAK